MLRHMTVTQMLSVLTLLEVLLVHAIQDLQEMVPSVLVKIGIYFLLILIQLK